MSTASQDTGFVERAVLGSILIDGNRFKSDHAGELRHEDFTMRYHQVIFKTMCDLYHREEQIDRVTVTNELMSHGALEAAGGAGYLADLDVGLPRVSNTMYVSYIKILKERTEIRRVEAFAETVTSRVALGGKPADIVKSIAKDFACLTPSGPAYPPIVIYSSAELHGMNIAKAEMLIENVLPESGATLIVGNAKSGKTLLACQMGISVAQGSPLLGNYPVLKAGGVLIVEQDDPGGVGSIRGVLIASGAPKDINLYLVPRVPFGLGPEMLEWLERQITTLDLRLVVLDSYTALRGSRVKGGDIVKSEYDELSQLDELAKRLGSAIALIHHGSKGAAANDWSAQAAGTFAMTAATEGQIHISRYSEFAGAAPERLIRVRGRHLADLELVLRLRPESLNYEYVLDGGGAPFYPLLLQIKRDFAEKSFGPKDLSLATGISRATINRNIQQLLQSDVLRKRAYGEYVLAVNL